MNSYIAGILSILKDINDERDSMKSKLLLLLSVLPTVTLVAQVPADVSPEPVLQETHAPAEQKLVDPKPVEQKPDDWVTWVAGFCKGCQQNYNDVKARVQKYDAVDVVVIGGVVTLVAATAFFKGRRSGLASGIKSARSTETDAFTTKLQNILGLKDGENLVGKLTSELGKKTTDVAGKQQ